MDSNTNTEEKPKTLSLDLQDKVLEYVGMATEIVNSEFPQYHSKPELIVEIAKMIQLEEQWNID